MEPASQPVSRNPPENAAAALAEQIASMISFPNQETRKLVTDHLRQGLIYADQQDDAFASAMIRSLRELREEPLRNLLIAIYARRFPTFEDRAFVNQNILYLVLTAVGIEVVDGPAACLEAAADIPSEDFSKPETFEALLASFADGKKLRPILRKVFPGQPYPDPALKPRSQDVAPVATSGPQPTLTLFPIVLEETNPNIQVKEGAVADYLNAAYCAIEELLVQIPGLDPISIENANRKPLKSQKEDVRARHKAERKEVKKVHKAIRATRDEYKALVDQLLEMGVDIREPNPLTPEAKLARKRQKLEELLQWKEKELAKLHKMHNRVIRAREERDRRFQFWQVLADYIPDV